MASSRFIDWLTNLTAKSTTIDGSEITHIGSSGLSQKATTKDLVSYVAQNLAQTWNAAGTVFTALKMNVTDTASSASSLLMDLQVGGSSKFKVEKSGKVLIPDVTYSFANATSTGIGRLANDVVLYSGATPEARLFSGSAFSVSSSTAIGFCSGAVNGTTTDTFVYRDAAGTLAQRNSTNAQESRLYGTYTDASNYRRLTYKMSTAGVAELKPEGAGTGASGNVLHISGLPTSNPGPGILWNDGGTIKVGT